MKLRSLLFVPGDRPERFAKAAASGADALILDLEDSVAASGKIFARDSIANFLALPERAVPLFVRINPLDSAFVADDLAAVAGHNPDGIMLPKAEGGKSVTALLARLAKLGNDTALIFPLATETPAAIFEIGSFRNTSPRIVALSWGAEDLPAAIGAATAREADGSYTPPYELARSLTLFGAHAAGVSAIETVFPDIKNTEGLTTYAARGRRDGFTGMMAIHPAQIPFINNAFTPTEAELAHAQKIVDAFAAAPDAGVLQIDGKMVDAPHLKQARRILALSGR